MATGPAHAQPVGVVIEATGGYAVGDNGAEANFMAAKKAFSGLDPLSQSVNPLGGYYAGLRISKNIMPLWDVAVGLSSTDVKGSANYLYPFSTPYTSDKVGQLTDELAFQTLDLEAGYTPVLGNNLDVRFLAGLRGLHYATTLDASQTYHITYRFPSPEPTTMTIAANFMVSVRGSGWRWARAWATLPWVFQVWLRAASSSAMPRAAQPLSNSLILRTRTTPVGPVC